MRSPDPPGWLATHADALQRLAKSPGGDRAAYLIRHGSMRVGVYAPRGTDDQTPHAQDELYIIASGGACFTKGASSVQVSSGDLLFVEAGVEHRFSMMSEDFSTWVVFWGPIGGEPARPPPEAGATRRLGSAAAG